MRAYRIYRTCRTGGSYYQSRCFHFQLNSLFSLSKQLGYVGLVLKNFRSIFQLYSVSRTLWSFLGFLRESLISLTLSAWISISSISSGLRDSFKGSINPLAQLLVCPQISRTFLPTWICSLSDSWNWSISKQGMSMKLSVEASSKALTTKLFIMTRSLKRQLMLSCRKRRVLLRWWALRRELRMGMRALMILQSLKIQMKRILVPLLKIQSKGISPCLQVWQSSQLVLSFMMQLYCGISSSQTMNSSSFSGLGSISLCLYLEGLVNVLIFLLRMMSQTSYLDILDISIKQDIIFSFREQLAFYSSCFISTFRNAYSPFWEVFQRKSSRVGRMISVARLSVSRPIFFSYLCRGSSLKSEETSFITILIQLKLSRTEPELCSQTFHAKTTDIGLDDRQKSNSFVRLIL